MQLTTFSFLSAFVFNSVIASPRIDRESGFDCGRVFFGRNVIGKAGSLVSQHMKRSSQISFVGADLMHRGGKLNHVGWPIRESGQIFSSSRSRESFYIIVDYSSGRVKNVMARLLNDDFTRCSRKNSRRKSPLLDRSNGYRCGQNFFGDEQLRSDADEAMSSFRQGFTYPSLYHGNLYPGHDYLTWPISNEKKDNISDWEQSPFHIILSRDGRIVDVVAKLKCNNFIKCERATKSLRGRSTKTSLLQRRAFQAPSDFRCGRGGGSVKFEHGYLDISRKRAMLERADVNQNNPNFYPKEYNKKGQCLAQPCKLWPIFPGRQIYNNRIEGQAAGYFLMMDSNFEILEVLSQGQSDLILCERVYANNPTPFTSPNNPGLSAGKLQSNDRGELIARPGTIRPVSIKYQKPNSGRFGV